MRIIEMRTLAGPNIYSYRPVLLMKIDLERLSEQESREYDNFNSSLLNLLPGLNEHHCSKGKEGGFVERLHEGTYFGHVIEHVAIELTQMVGLTTNHGKTRSAGAPGIYHIAIEYQAETGTRFLMHTAVSLVEAILRKENFPLAEKLLEAEKIILQTEPGPSTQAIIDAAVERGIPYSRIGNGSLVQLGYGIHRRQIQAALTSRTSAIAVDIACDKILTKQILSEAGLPVPEGRRIHTAEDAITAFHEIGAPVAIKPVDGCQGRGVSLNLTTEDQVRQAFRIASRHSATIIIEQQLIGHDYRVLVINGKAVAACEREPAKTIGDGKHSIAELIDRENLNPLRGDGHEKPLSKIAINDVLLESLRKRELDLQSIPERGESVILVECANLSTGGTARDVSHLLHAEIATMCERAARLIGLDVCGIDLILDDISRPLQAGNGIIEVNAAPGLRMHLAPSMGASREVGKAIVEMLYPERSPSRIPIISITGTNGKTTITRLIGHVISETGKTVGMTTTDGIYLDGQKIVSGDTTGPRSAHTILSDPSVEVAVLETARGGIVRRGLGYDWSDIAILSNVRLDHIGQDGIENLEDLLFIKSLVAERVREGGTLVLNADDERLAQLMELPRVNRIKKNVIYFAMHPFHVTIRRHLDAGGTAFLYKDGWLIEARGSNETRIVRAGDLPITLGGIATFHIANALAAAAACRAYGLGLKTIANALKTFQQSEGRAGLYAVAGGYALVDYGHNPDAFAAIGQMAKKCEGRPITGIIGVPGDRNNSVVEQAGQVAAQVFQKIIIKEDHDLRGRPANEVAALLMNAIRNEIPERDCRIVLDELEALRLALREINPGEIIVVFYEKLEPILAILKEFEARPVTMIKPLESQPKNLRKMADWKSTRRWRMAQA